MEISKEATTGMKAIAVFMVIASHLGFGFGVNGVGIFLLLSGFGLSKSYGEEIDAKRFLLRRAGKLLPLFFVFISLQFIIFGGDLWDMLFFQHTWFVPYILFWYLAYLACSGKMKWLLAIAIMLILMRPIYPPELFRWFIWALCFPLGVWMAREKRDLLGMETGIYIGIITWSLIIGWALQDLPHYPITATMAAVGLVGLLYKARHLLENNAIVWIGRRSCGIYLFHVWFLP